MDRFSIAFHALFTPTWWRAGAALSLALATVLSAGCATRLDADGRAAVAGKTFVVTGASSGFGRGVARELGRLRANVVLAARRGDVLDDVASEVAVAGGQALVVVTDVSRADEVVRLGARAVERFGDIDVWINNAGVGAIGPLEVGAQERQEEAAQPGRGRPYILESQARVHEHEAVLGFPEDAVATEPAAAPYAVRPSVHETPPERAGRGAIEVM